MSRFFIKAGEDIDLDLQLWSTVIKCNDLRVELNQYLVTGALHPAVRIVGGILQILKAK